MHVTLRAVAVALLLASGSTKGGGSPASADLTGHWVAVLDSSTNLELHLTKIAPRELTDPSLRNMQVDHPTHSGAFRLTGPRVLDSSPSDDQLPPVLARQWADDSVLIAVRPYVDHGSLVLTGKVIGDSVTGVWVVTSYMMLDRGRRFVMRRVNK